MPKRAPLNRCVRLFCGAARGAVGLARAALGALLALCGGPVLAQTPAPTALPTGAHVVSGTATLQQTGAQLTVQQASDKLITNWQSFNIGAGATVRFNQPGAASVALNRVLSNDPSAIYGTLQSNGQVFLVNPSGVLFGASARVDVGGLVASSLQLADADFLAGRYRFGGNAASGAVGNEGRISAAQGGYLAFIAPRVNNTGSLRAPQGTVALGAGEQASLDFAGDKLLRFTVDQGTVAALVDNQGLIQASGGSVLLTARAADAVTRAVVNQGGVVDASSLVAKGGRVVLEGDAITLKAGSRTEAKGVTGGGAVLVGGDWQGGVNAARRVLDGPDAMRQATTVTQAEGAHIDASATAQGNGGTVVLWSDVHNPASVTSAQGSIFARGGAAGGNGGQVETSSHRIDTDGIRVDAGAAQGHGGLWLIDPVDSTITQAVANGYQATLNTGTSVLNDVTGSINWNNGVTLNKTAGGAATLTLRIGSPSDGSGINLNGATIGSTSGALNLVLWTRYTTPGQDGTVSLINSTINTNGGHFWAGGGNATTWNGLAVGNDLASTWYSDIAGITLRNSSISSGAGNIYLGGRSWATGVNNAGVRNFGLLIDSGSSIASTSGSIDLNGALLGRYANGAGVWIGTPSSAPIAGNVAVTTDSGAIDITGTGTDQSGSSNGWRVGVMLYSGSLANQISVRSTSGAINLTGTGTFGTAPGLDFTNDTSGLQFQSDTTGGQVQVVSSTGAITLSGQNSQQSSQFEAAMRFAAANTANNIRIGSDGSTPYSGNILIEGDSIVQRTQQPGSGSIAVQTTGGLTIAPRGTSFVALRADNAGTLTFDNDWNFGSTLGSFTLGKAGNTFDLSLSNALSTAGPISLYGGNLDLNANLTSTAAGAAILAKASGNITSTASRTFQTNNGGIVLWSDSDANNSGSIALGDNNTINSANGSTASNLTGGGRIVLAGGADTNGDGAPDGFAQSTSGDAVALGTSSAGTTRLASGGGDIVINGRSTASSGVNQGIQAWGALTADSGQGAITMSGQSSAFYGVEFSRGLASGTGLTLSSSKSTGTAISITGSTTAASTYGLVFDFNSAKKLIANGGGGINLSGTGTGTAYGMFMSNTSVLATSGDITLDGGVKGIVFPTISATLGANGSDVVSSSSNITLTGDAIGVSVATAVNTSGTLKVQPYSASFTSALTWPPSNLTLGSGVSGLTLGKAGNTANITVTSATSIAGPISIYGGNLALNANLTSTAAGAAILASASGNISQAANVALNTQGGHVSLLANSDGNTVNYGSIVLNSASSISSTGGNILLGGGLGGTGSATVRVTGLGNSGSETAGETQAGVALFNAQIDAGSGSVTLRGRAVGTPDDYSHGVSIRGDAGTSSIVGAAITIEGESDTAANVGGNGSSNRGISVINSSVAGSGDVQLTGTGSAGTGGSGNNNRGVFLSAATVTSSAAAVQLSGTGRSVGGGNGGVLIAGNSLVRGTTATTVTGSGSATGFGNSTGVAITGATTRVASSANGAIDISGSKGGGASVGVELSGGATLGSVGSASAITVSADELSTPSAFNIHTTGALTVQPLSTSFAAPLTWPLANLTYLATPGGLTLGKVGNTANITVSGAQTIAGPISVYGGNIAINAGLTATGNNTITLQGTGTVTDGVSGFIVADNLLLLGGNVTLDAASNNVGTLAASGVGGLSYTDSNALTLGTVGATNGVAATGLMNIGTTTGHLTVAQNVSTTHTTASALVLNAGVSTAAGTATGGNIVISGSPTLSVGSGGRATLYSGSVADSTGLTALVGSGSGRFRYNSDENSTNFSVALGTGLHAIYREQPTAAVAVDNKTITYGDALPTLTGTTSGVLNGDALYAITSPLYAGSGNLRASGSPYTLTSNLAGLGYNLTSNTNGTLTLNVKALTVSGLTSADKVYDGNTAATVSGTAALLASQTPGAGSSSDGTAFTGDTVSLSGAATGSFNTKDVTTATSVAFGGISLTGADAGNYTLTPHTSVNQAITPKALTATVTAPNKVYDGGTNAAPVLTIASGLVGTETVAASGTGSFNSKDVLTANLVTVATATLANGSNGGLASNYSLSSGQTVAANITQKALTATASAANKEYDGHTTAAPVLTIASGLVGTETVAATGTGSFNSKDVLTATTVTISSTMLANGSNGGLASNYSLATGQTAAASITPKALMATATAPDKVYDGNTSAAPVLTIASGLIASETVTATGTASFNSKDVLTASTVTVGTTTLADGSNGGLASNYSLSAGQTATAAITPKALTASAITADKVYDGTTAASATLTLSGLIASETLGASGAASFNSKDVLTANTVTINSTTLADGSNGGLASNYSLAAGQTAAAAITAKALTAIATAPDKVYDGSTAATATLTLSGLIASEMLGISGTANFNSKDVLTAHTVTVTATALADGSNGGLASNYSLAAGQTVAAAITPKALTATATATNKAYDGTTTANATLTLSGLIASETLGSSSAASFNSKDVLTANTVTVDTATLTDGSNGGLASNYNLAAGQMAAAAITAKALTATASAPDKVYDGTTSAAPALAITAGLVGSETLAVNVTGSFNSKDVLTANTVTVNTASLADGSNGGLASNYTLGTGQTATASITPAALTAAATAPAKVYDGTTAAAPTLAITAGLVGSETVTAVATGSFNSKDVLTASTVTVDTTVLANGSNGGLASNYMLGTGQVAAAAITPKQVTLAGGTREVKTYDGHIALASGSLGHGSLVGLVGSEVISVTGSPVFDSANAGARSVLQGNVALGGPGSANYSLAWTNGSGNINKAGLTVRAIDDARFVTLADSAGFNGVSYSGFVNGETPAVVGGALQITRNNAGTNGAGVYSGVLMPSGLTAANYTLSYGAGDYTIVPAGQLLVRTANTSLVYGSALVYNVTSAQYLDGSNVIQTLAAPSVVGNTYTYNDGAGGTARFTLAPSIGVRSGAGLLAVGNYGLAASSVSESSANFSNSLVVVGNLAVTPKSVSVVAGGVSKVYDGSAAVTGLTLNLNGMLTGDAVSASGQGQFAGKNVGTGLGYTVKGLVLASADAGNYFLGASPELAGADGSITPKDLTVSGISAADKVYDGNTTASVSTAGVVLAGLVTGDVLNISASGQFVDKNTAVGKTVTLITSYSGADAGNYRIVGQGSTTASISRLGQVTWIGGATGNWFDPAHWAGGAVPDLANVSQVVIPASITVKFGDTVVAPAERGAVQIDRLGSLGSLAMTAGTLDVGAGGVALSRLTQSGGALTSLGDMRIGSLVQSGGTTAVQGALTVAEDFEQGRSGSIVVRGRVSITDTSGGAALGNLTSGGPLTVSSLDGDIRQIAGTTLVAQSAASFTARTSSGRPADVILTEAANDFMGRVDLSARNAELTDRNGVALGVLALTGNLTLASNGDMDLGQGSIGGGLLARSNGGDVTQTGALLVDGGTDVAAGAGRINLNRPDNRLGGLVQLAASGGGTVQGASSAAVNAATNAATQALTTQAADPSAGATGSSVATRGAPGALGQTGAARPLSVSTAVMPLAGELPSALLGESSGRFLFELADTAGRDVAYEAELIGTTLRIEVRSSKAVVDASSSTRRRVIEAALQALEAQLGLPRSRVSVVYLAN